MDRWLVQPDLRNPPRYPYFHISSASVAALVLALLITAPVARGGWREDIGLSQLRARLGGGAPTGAAISVSQVEMCVHGGDYVPDGRDGCFVGKSINLRSGDGGFSNHATTVSQYYFGVGSSPALGIRSADIYEANGWVNDILHVGSRTPPSVESRQVQNHSWVGSLGSVSLDVDAIRRTDLMVQRDGVLVAAGLNNGRNTAMPRLMCSAYNVISVGLTNGDASRGITTIEGLGRVKPDLVAPLGATSWATPVVAASGALLLEAEAQIGALDELPADRRPAARALLAKTLLMGGATKTEWPDWRKGFTVPCTDGSVPLDCRYGAGELNIGNSYRLLSSGRWSPGDARLVPAAGWDFGHVAEWGRSRYFFDIPAASRAAQASVMMVWNRQIDAAPGAPLRLKATLPNLDLALFAARDFSPGARIDASTSRVDNVEHLYLTRLAPGRYAIEVSSDRASDYCLTWDIRMQAQPSPSMALSD